MKWVAPLVLVLVVIGGCSGQIGAPFGQPVPGREDVSLIEYRAHVVAGLSDAVTLELPEGTGAALIEAVGARGQFRLAQLTTPAGLDLVESGGFVTRDAREATGLVDWLYPNTPSLHLDAGGYRIRLTALEASGEAVGDEELTVRVYTRSRPAAGNGGRLHLDIHVADGALGPADLDRTVDALVAQVGVLYAQAGVSIADYTVTPVHLASPDLTLEGGRASTSALSAVAEALNGARPSALHLLIVRSLDDADGPVAGYSLGLPGPFSVERPTAAVLVAASAFASPSSGMLDLGAMAVTCAHEMGHYLGLYHTSERDGRQHDPIPDTAECSGASGCEDATNIMFWTGGAARSRLSAGQAAVMRLHPLCEEGDPRPTGPTPCAETCVAPSTCAHLDGKAGCQTACAPGGDPCPDGSACLPSDEGTYVCQ